ncbi:MAG TPA: adenine phosphoribosyltransferase [Thermoanaerobaculia bacterium]|nr:adenine phosphoribosyltransferase [Thermoanaerobaculia bacterium]
MDLVSYIRDVPDFPKPGITFKDITPLLASPDAFREVIARLAEPFGEAGITRVAAIESRGFIFGGALAERLGCGFVPIRKPGKLPWTTHSQEYTLEYGTDVLEIHSDAMGPGDRVLLVDDVLATGGTAAAAAALLSLFRVHVAGFAVVIELQFLGGRSRLSHLQVESLIRYS